MKSTSLRIFNLINYWFSTIVLSLPFPFLYLIIAVYTYIESFSSLCRWIPSIFEPIRNKYYTRPVEIPFFLTDKKITPSIGVVKLVAMHPQTKGTWKEVYVFKHRKMVHIYDVFSHGRRFHRSLIYTSNAKYTLKFLQPAPDDRQAPWPEWERYAAGNTIPVLTLFCLLLISLYLFFNSLFLCVSLYTSSSPRLTSSSSSPSSLMAIYVLFIIPN